MKNAVLVVLVVLLATIMLPPTANAQSVRMSGGRGGRVIEGPGYVVATNGGPSVVMRQSNGCIDTGVGGGYRGSNRSRNDYSGGHDNGYSSGRRGGGNSTGISVGLGTRIGGIRVNVGYSKTTYSKPSKPKPKPRPQIVVVQKPASDKCRMTLVREVGDKLETISPIVVTNPEKELAKGTSIVFNRNGEFFAEYSVLRVVGDTVFVEVVDAPRGNPRQGDTFSIEAAEK